jgi:two-component system copper resistance phosphate regulon response regulator CusR
MRVLVIEDELKTSAYLRQGLSENGFTVEVCANGEDGLHQALSVGNDLIILDVMLPKRDGQSSLRCGRPADKRPCFFSLPVTRFTTRSRVWNSAQTII